MSSEDSEDSEMEEVKVSTFPKPQTYHLPHKNEGDYLLHRADRLRKRRTFLSSTSHNNHLPYSQLLSLIHTLQASLIAFDADNTTLLLKQAHLQLLNHDVYSDLMSQVTRQLLDNLSAKQRLQDCLLQSHDTARYGDQAADNGEALFMR